jgi:cytochrome c2
MSRAGRLALAALLLAGLAFCGREETAPSRTVHGGDARRGRAAIERHGCGSCHVIPGIRTARGVVGPALTDFGRRPYIAGVLVHDLLNLLRWLQDPPAVAPGTVMPRLGVSEGDARDIAAYLYRDMPDRAGAHPAPGAPGGKAPDG